MKMNYIYPIALSSFTILMGAIRTADSLSGKFFGSTFPVVSNFYANDFLGWGIILFSTIGILAGNVSFKFIKDKRWEYIGAFVVIIVLTIGLRGIGQNLRIGGNEDYRILDRLLDAWSTAFIYSGMFFPIVKLIEIYRPKN